MKFNSLKAWLDWQTQLHAQSIDMGLERIRPVYQKLIQQKLAKKIIMVAGTNGKGSTVAILESLYVSGGYRVGTYTSPHLQRYNERVRLQGTPVSDEQLCQAFDHVETSRGETSLTYFEFGTLAAFDIFQDQNLDVAILEVGLGGRLDAVNLVDADVSIITNIQLDHVDWLGDTREQIAVEKLGIAREGKPLIIADDDLPENVLPLLSEKNLTAYIIGESFGYTRQGESWDWWGDVADQKRLQKHSLPLPALRGPHQLKNAASALTATVLLNADLPLSMSHIRVGLSNVTLPGRFQIEQVQGKTVILDVAHNPHGIKAFIDNLKQLPDLGETYLVFAMLKDKAVEEVVTLLNPMADHWLLAPLEHERAIPIMDLTESVLFAAAEDRVDQFPSVAEACGEALRKMQTNDRLLVVGSFFTVADALTCLNNY